jgi:pyridoxal phosphate enzyme (YggS family)
VTITKNVKQILAGLPDGVELMAAAKTRTPGEILEAVNAGVRIVGENYVQEAERAYREIGGKARWHFIGRLQKNKVKKAVEIFDMIETVDSLEIAEEIDKRCAQAGKVMPALIEINSGREAQKSGVYPEDALKLVTAIAPLKNIRVMGLMTMGTLTGRVEETRRCFAAAREIFERLKKLKIPGIEMKYLSMGMTDSYEVALEEGASIIRIGRGIFGGRD